LPKNTTQNPLAGPEPRPLYPEMSALTMRPLCPHREVAKKNLKVTCNKPGWLFQAFEIS